MSVLLTGASGYVGNLIYSEFKNVWDIVGVGRSEHKNNDFKLDISDPIAVEKLAQKISPDVIIHAAGNKDVSACESDSRTAYLANTQTTFNLISSFPNTRIIYLSSDYVFSGNEGDYTEDALVNPITVYGKTKVCSELQGMMLHEQFHVLRLSALYDQNAAFVRFVHESLKKNNQIDCFDNVFYSPTFYRDFLNTVQKLVESSVLKENIYHACGVRLSRYEFAICVAQVLGENESLIQRAQYQEGTASFLFPDLSLNNAKTRDTLSLSLSEHK
jgi:dTDP-4-dehydrorhamnose reductase